MGDDKIDFRDIVQIIVRHRNLVYYVTFCAIVVAVILNLFLAPVYESTVSVKVKCWGVNEGIGTSLPTAGENLTKEQINTYAEIFKSRTVVNETIDKLYGFDGNRPNFERIADRIQIRPVKESEILNVTIQADSAEEAQKIAGTLLDVFMSRVAEIARSEGKDGREFIGERLVDAKKNLDKLEKELVAYKKKNATVAVSEQTRSFMERQTALKRMSVENQIMTDSAAAKLANANQEIATQKPGFVADSLLIQQLRTKLADQEVTLASMRKTLTADHPNVISLQAAVQETRSRLNAEVDKVLNAEAPSSNPIVQVLMQDRIQANADVMAGQAQQGALRRAEYEVDAEIKNLPEKEQGLARLNRDYLIAEENYTVLSKRYEQVRIDEVMKPSNVQIVDEANLPEQPVKPRKFLNVVMAAVFGLFFGVMATFFVDFFRKTIDTAQDARQYLGIRVIGCIPRQGLYRTTAGTSFWKQLVCLGK